VRTVVRVAARHAFDADRRTMPIRFSECQMATDRRVNSSTLGEPRKALNHDSFARRITMSSGRNGVKAEVQHFVHGSGSKDTNS
jgi:hypothetical protein